MNKIKSVQDQYARTWNTARREQGFRSQAHLDAWYTAYDHVEACPACGQLAGAWIENGSSWQPAKTRCAEWRRLDDLAR